MSLTTVRVQETVYSRRGWGGGVDFLSKFEYDHRHRRRHALVRSGRSGGGRRGKERSCYSFRHGEAYKEFVAWGWWRESYQLNALSNSHTRKRKKAYILCQETRKIILT